MRPLWTVQHYKEGDQHELSVVMIGCHGSHSWGWPGDDKIILIDGEVSRKMFNFLEKYAYMMCAELNLKAGCKVPVNP